MKKFIKVICLLLCMTMTTALFVACAKSDDESQGSTNSGGLQIKLSDYFEEEVKNTLGTVEEQQLTTTLTKLTDNIAWNSDNLPYKAQFTVKKDFRLLGVSFDIKALQNFGTDNSLNIQFRYNENADTMFNFLNEELYNQWFKMNANEVKNFSYDFTKKYISKGYPLEKGSTFAICSMYIATIDNIKFTINPA